MIRLALLLLLLLAPGLAAAHGVRLFATVEGQEVVGYGFFIGGGRPEGARWRAEAGGEVLAEGRTDAQGGFRLPAPGAGPLTLTLDTGDGHVAELTLGPGRFGAPAAAAPAPAPAATAPADAAPAPAPAPDTAALEAALARQIAPLSAQIAELETRLRLTDLVAALCLIFGLAGLALWARGARK